MTNEARLSEDKAARAMVDAARLADELRCEQDVAMCLEKDKKLLEAQCKDAGSRADEAEVNALKGGRKAMIKMETHKGIRISTGCRGQAQWRYLQEPPQV